MGRNVSRRPGRPVRALTRLAARAAAEFLLVLVALAAAPMFGSAGVAHAQTLQVLVSNLGQPMATAGGTEHGVAQAFRTGANTDGYTLTSIDLRLELLTAPTVTLRRGSAAGSTVASFTAPSTTGTGFAAYTFIPTTTVTLDRNTDYWVVVAGGSFGWVWSVTGPAEDATPAPGWSLADRGQFFNPNSGSWGDNDGDWTYQISVKGTIRQPLPPPGGGGGGGGGGSSGPRQTVPDAPTNLIAEAADAAVTLTWDAPKDDGGAAITDYEYRINRRNPWISIGSTGTTHTVTGLVNGTAYVFEVRAVNRIGRSRASNRAEATPIAPVALDFAHFANGTGITSGMVLVNVATHPIRPAIYFYDRGGHLIDPESVVEVTGDMEVTEDGSLSVLTEMEPLGELTISTHGQGELVSGSVKVLSDGPIGGLVRYGVPEIGVAGVGASPPVRDVLFPARRQEGGIRTAAALHNLGEEAMGVNCRLMSGGVALEEAEIPLEANGQTSWFIEDTFTATDTSDFLGSVRCTAPSRGMFTAIAVEMDVAQRIFTMLSVVPVERTGGGNKQTTLILHISSTGPGSPIWCS